MSVIERPPIETKSLREEIEALQPGDVFSIDRPITVDEFCEYVRDEGAAELVNGVVYIMSPPTDKHEALCVWLTRVIGLYAELRGLGEVRASKSGVLISRTSLREPDLLFFRTERLDQMTARGVHGAPDLVVEIVDSAKARREAVEKQVQYEAIGVAELWVIDLPREEVRLFTLQEGAYERIAPQPDGEIASQTVEGFHLQAAWLFAAPTFPNSLEVVQTLLAGD